MRRMLLLLLLLLLPAVPAYAQPANNAHVTQVDSSHYPDVTLYVSVTDSGGKPVGGLMARDFAITEDGQPVAISNFAGGGASSVSTALVIDRSGSMEENDKIDGAKDAARAFVEQMRPGDRTALIAFSSDTRMLQPFTADQASLLDAIDQIGPGGGTALYDSMAAGVDALANMPGRRALLLLTDGQDCRESRTCPARYGSRRSLDQTIAYANQHAQPLYVVGLGDRGSDDRDGIDEPVLQQIARATNGEYFYAPSGDQLAGLYRRLSSDLQQEYTLTYRSPRPFYDGTRRDIRVSVGGAPAASGGYVERHLINVRSDPFVGVLLLLPIVGALLLPAIMRRRARGPGPAGAPLNVPIVVDTPSDVAPAIGATILQPHSVVVIPPDVPRCRSCDAPLLRAGARFCAECGAPQAIEPAARPSRIFCDQCGRPMREGAQFCAHCGATAPVMVGAWNVER
jgi:VWFA-related protein